jgi:hypothetical protein
MACDYRTYDTATIELLPGPRASIGPADQRRARETETDGGKSLKDSRPRLTADQIKSKEHRREIHSRIIPDSTQTEPEYVWGDEGPINE